MNSMYRADIGGSGAPDGSVVIAASMDTGEIRRAAEEIGRILTRMRENTARQSAALRGNVSGEAARGAASVLGTTEALTRRMEHTITVGGSGILRAAGGVMGNVLSLMLDRAGSFTAVGEGMMRSVAGGISSSAAITDAAARAAAQSALRAMQAELGITMTQNSAKAAQPEESLYRKNYPVTGETVLRASGVIGAQSVTSGVSMGGAAVSSAAGTGKKTGGTNMTVVFTKPVETPAAHAKALKQTMEEMLYG